MSIADLSFISAQSLLFDTSAQWQGLISIPAQWQVQFWYVAFHVKKCLIYDDQSVYLNFLIRAPVTRGAPDK